MSVKYFADRVRETSTVNGTGSLTLAGPLSGFKSFISAIGQNRKLTYYIYKQDNFEWEIGVGYIFESGGLNILVREKVVSSSSNNNFVSFTTGVKFIETIISQDRVNSSFINVVETSGNFLADYMPSIYVVDASVTGIQINLPEVANEDNPIVLGFVLNKTIGDQYSQPNAIVLSPSGSETINGSSSYDISVRDDYVQIMSLPSQTGWVLLDPIQDSTNPYGNDGSVQIKYDSAFSGVPGLNWNFSESALLIGGTGNSVTATVIIPSGSGSTIVFNEQSHPNDFRVEGSGATHLLFIDGSENKIAINSSNAYDSLIINAQYGNGITIQRSGTGPRITLNNTSISGVTSNDIIGSIVFSGLSNSGSIVEYANIYSTIQDSDNNSESSSIDMEIIKNGSLEKVFELGASGLTIGFNNSNFDGIIIGEVSQNEGNNIVLGYYHNICGDSCVAIGHNASIASGSFGGVIGVDHETSGNNIWVFGGSGVITTGNNITYLAIDDNNYISLDGSGNFVHSTYSSGNQSFDLYNRYAISGSIDQYFNFIFTNSSSVVKTGLALGCRITDPTNSSEDSKLFASILYNGSGIDILSLSHDSISLGNSSISGNNIVFAIDSSISGINNIITGSGIVNSGNTNVIVGSNITHSGNNTVIFGKDITCLTSGNIGITIFGTNNTADEDYVTVFGNSNSVSGLYGTAIGYLNGVHGEYSVGVGEGNTILTDGSVSVGNNNSSSPLSVDATSFIVGIGNTVQISNTGFIIGYNNDIYGSGGLILGQNSVSSGNNNFIVGKDVTVSGINNVVIGNNINLTDNNIVDIHSNPTNGITFSSSGIFIDSDSPLALDNHIIVDGSGIFNSGILNSGNLTCAQTGVFGNIIAGTGNVVKLFAINDYFSVGLSTWNSGIIEVNDEGDFSVYRSGQVKVIDIDYEGTYATGNFTSFSSAKIVLPSLISVSGTGSVVSLSYQNNEIHSNSLAYSGVPGTGLQLVASDSEYQFLYPAAATYVYLPNGSGLFMGKKFTVANMSNSNTVYIRKSGSVSDLGTLSPGYNMGIVHAGTDNWVRISYHGGGFSNVPN